MPMQQVEYKFPDPDEKGGKEVEVEITEQGEFELEVEGAVGREEVGNPNRKLRKKPKVKLKS